MTALDLNNKRILVTGSAGFLGRQVIDQLCQAGADKNKITVTRSHDCDLRVLENCQRAVDQQDIISIWLPTLAELG
jgi:GDP-L-fucose synthase